MKKLIALSLAFIMVLSLGACSQKPADPDQSQQSSNATDKTNQNTDEGNSSGKKVLNIWTWTKDVPNMAQLYLDQHPDLAKKYEIKATIIANDGNAYTTALDQALVNGGADAPDLYCCEAAFVLKYTQGEAARYGAAYKDLGIDVENDIKKADIAPYVVDIGTRDNKDVVALAYQSTGGAFIYRRSIAKAVFGTDEPEKIGEIIGAGSGNWDKYFEAAEKIKAKGYSMNSSRNDIWNVVQGSSEQGWVVDGKLTIDPNRDNFMELSKMQKENDYTNDTQLWTEGWFADMKGAGPREVFGYFGPAWLVNYSMARNAGGTAIGEGTFGDWALCQSPIGYCMGGTWLMANNESKNKEIIGDIIHFITLDTSKDAPMSLLATGALDADGRKDTVASGVVMNDADGSIDYLNGQNMFDIYIPANKQVNGKNLTAYDSIINNLWLEQVNQYAAGEKNHDQAIKDFKQNVADNLDIIVDP